MNHCLDAVDHFDVVGIAGQDRVLAASAGVDELLIAHGRVVDDGRYLDVLAGTLTRLVVGREAPRVDLAVPGQGEAVVRASGDSDDERNI